MNLASMSELCVQGCTATFTGTNVQITDSEGHIVLSGTKAASDLVWQLPLPIVGAPDDNPVTVDAPFNRVPTSSAAIHHQLDAEYVRFTLRSAARAFRLFTKLSGLATCAPSRASRRA